VPVDFGAVDDSGIGTARVEISGQTLDSLREMLPVLIALVASGAAAFAYCTLLASVHAQAKRMLEYYRELGRQVQTAEASPKPGGESRQLAKTREIHSALRALLEREGLLARPAAKKGS
jgi:hypothetical protein